MLSCQNITGQQGRIQDLGWGRAGRAPKTQE